MRILYFILLGFISCNETTDFRGGRTVPQWEDYKKEPPIEELDSEAKKELPTIPDDEIVPPFSFSQIERSFDVGRLANQSVQTNFSDDLIQSTLTLRSEKKEYLQTYKQPYREKIVDRFTQGQKGKTVRENFTQTDSNGSIDLLIVIDNSRSMKQEQKNLSNKLDPLLKYIDDTQWRIGITTTDPDDTCLREVITVGEENISQRFSQGVQAGIQGSGYERGFLRAVEGLKGKCKEQPWLRKNSNVAVLIVSDEDNCSKDSEDCKNEPDASHTYLTNYMKSIRPEKDQARVYGIIWHPSLSNSQCKSAESPAPSYAKAIEATSGYWGSICQSDYTQTLEQISKDIARTIQKNYTLQNIPEQDSMKVYINNELLTSGYTIVDKVVSFDPAPALSSKISIEYTVNSTKILKQFQLSESPVSKDLLVTVNGVTIDSSNYNYKANENILEFKNPPVEAASIRIEYKKNSPLESNFYIGPSRDFVSVSINNQDTSEYTYDTLSGYVKFDVPPEEGSSIELSSQTIAPVLTYPFQLLTENPYNFMVIDSDTGEPVSYTLGNKTLEIPNSDFRELRNLTVSYRDANQRDQIVLLPNTPLKETIAITVGTEVCDQYVLDDSLLSLKVMCSLSSNEVVQVDYSYIEKLENTFTIEEAKGLGDKISWEVQVNNEPITDFVRVDNQIFIDNLTWDDRVTIIVTATD